MIRKAILSEYDKVLSFYDDVIDGLKDSKYAPGWKKGIYPHPIEVKKAIENGELIVYEEGEAFISAMRLNHAATKGYEKAKWKIEAKDEEVLIIHMLGVSVSLQGRGIAKEMVSFVIDKARKEGQKAVRLDVLLGNLPAAKLYESCGFSYIETISMFYEDTGYTDYMLYEYVI